MSETLKGLDNFGVPINLKIKSKDVHMTPYGGCCSIIAGLIMYSFLIQQVILLYMSPDYSVGTNTTFRNFVTNTNVSVLTREQLGVAARLDSSHIKSDEEPKRIARVMFYSRKKESGKETIIKFYEPIPCKGLYKQQHEDDNILEEEFEDDSWLCPAVDTIELLNHPELFKNGSNFSLVVNRCDVAVQFSKDNGIDISDEVCADSATIDANIDSVSIEYKFLVQNFRPNFYREHGHMEFYVGTRAKQSIVPTQIGNQNYRVSYDKHTYFGELLADLSSWWDGFGTPLDAYHVVLSTPSTFSPKLFTDVHFGHYLITLNQCETMTAKSWQIRTIQTVLAEYGGYAAIVTSIFAFLIAPYQKFSYNQSLLQNFYYQRHNTDEDGDSCDDDDENDNTNDFEKELGLRTLNNRPFKLSYWEHTVMFFWTKCCCCIVGCRKRTSPKFNRRWNQYKKFDQAVGSMDDEIDLRNFIQNVRVSNFFSTVSLKKRQRDIINFFDRYLIKNKDIGKEAKDPGQLTVQHLTEGFDPKQDEFDRRILWETLHRRVEGRAPFSDLADSDDDGEVFESPNSRRVEHIQSEYQESLLSSSEPPPSVPSSARPAPPDEPRTDGHEKIPFGNAGLSYHPTTGIQ